MTTVARVRDAKARAELPPLALEAERCRTREEVGEIRNRSAEDRPQNVVALLIIGLLIEAAILAWLTYSIVF